MIKVLVPGEEEMAPRSRAKTNVEIVKCHGDLDASSMVAFKNKVTRLMNNNRKNVLLDLSKTKHVDLAGLGILVERIKKIRSINGDIKLCNIQPHVYETFRLVGVTKLVESYHTEEEARRSFQVA